MAEYYAVVLRAVAELERAGLIEVQRRKGYAPLVRLVPQRVKEVLT